VPIDPLSQESEGAPDPSEMREPRVVLAASPVGAAVDVGMEVEEAVEGGAGPEGNEQDGGAVVEADGEGDGAEESGREGDEDSSSSSSSSGSSPSSSSSAEADIASDGEVGGDVGGEGAVPAPEVAETPREWSGARGVTTLTILTRVSRETPGQR
jgi:hypothetical protein